MPNKAYAVIFNPDSRYLYFPIKRDGLVYGGMPQFFGGTKNANESDRSCISREMYEESDDTLSLASGGLSRVHSADVGASVYNFYVTTSWEGELFVGELENGEMQAIERFYTDEHGEDTVEDLCQRLGIVPTEEFMTSETYTAFDAALAWCDAYVTAGEDEEVEVEPV